VTIDGIIIYELIHEHNHTAELINKVRRKVKIHSG